MTGITVEGNSRLHIEGSQFVNNSHTLLEASALYIGGRTNATIEATSFTSNKAQHRSCGAALVCQQATGA
jgi:hypothetical protein